MPENKKNKRKKSRRRSRHTCQWVRHVRSYILGTFVSLGLLIPWRSRYEGMWSNGFLLAGHGNLILRTVRRTDFYRLGFSSSFSICYIPNGNIDWLLFDSRIKLCDFYAIHNKDFLLHKPIFPPSSSKSVELKLQIKIRAEASKMVWKAVYQLFSAIIKLVRNRYWYNAAYIVMILYVCVIIAISTAGIGISIGGQ